jgi:CubicO group peptidase (beta-lactamase class C family)
MTRGEATKRLLLAALALVWGCGDPTAPYPLAEAHGIDPAALEAAAETARASGTVHSLLVERHGVVVAEDYFAGYTRDSLNLIWSVTKSFTSTLVGIAIDQGFIEGVDQPIGDFLGGVVEDLAEEKRQITLRHLLTMSCGIPWIEGGLNSEYPQWMASPNQVRYFLDKDVEHEPGTYFDYSDGGAHLTGVVLQEAVGRSSLDFAGDHLFGPLGFAPARWDTDKQGYNLGGVGLWLRAADMLKLGRLFLDGGVWDGSMILSRTWIDDATAPHISWDRQDPDPSRAYGYFWWVADCRGVACYRASGYGGQLIVNVPSLDLVVVTTSQASWDRAVANASWEVAYDLIVEEVIPGVR